MYRPAGTSANAKLPSESDVVVRLTRARLSPPTSCTIAPASGARAMLSCTTPVTVERGASGDASGACAAAIRASTTTHNTGRNRMGRMPGGWIGIPTYCSVSVGREVGYSFAARSRCYAARFTYWAPEPNDGFLERRYLTEPALMRTLGNA